MSRVGDTVSRDPIQVASSVPPDEHLADGSRHDRRPASRSPRGVRLLDVDPRLGERLSATQWASAHERVVLPTIEAARGAWDPERLTAADGLLGDVCGFMVIEGMALMAVALGGRSCLRLVGPGDVVLLGDTAPGPIPVTRNWQIRSRAQFLVFDQRLGTIAHYWPALFAAVLARAAQHANLAFLQQAISQLPRVDERLLALLWTLAERYGTTSANGVHVQIDLSHETLAQMIGARRPTVSLGLSRLIDAQLLAIAKDGYLLAPESIRLLSSVAPDESTPET